MDTEKTANAIASLWKLWGTPMKVTIVAIAVIVAVGWTWRAFFPGKSNSTVFHAPGQIGNNNQMNVILGGEDEEKRQAREGQLVEKIRDEIEESKRTKVPTFPRKLADGMKVGENLEVNVTKGKADAYPPDSRTTRPSKSNP